MDLSLIKVIVFDLDGTLYEDTHHFDYYATRLREKLASDKVELFDEDYRLARAENHTLQIGRVYDVKKDLILVQLDNRVQVAYDWEGNALPKDRMEELYPEPIVMDLDMMLNVGDLWWVPGSIARHHGLSSEQAYEAFLETRTFMMGPEFKMNQIEGLKETLENIRNEVKLVLLTNSPEPDSEAILEKLGLSHVFHKKIFMGKKPMHTLEHVTTITKEFGVDFSEILSIGDNWINEIRPVQPLGCSTIYIDPHEMGDTADIIIKSMSEAIPYLKKFQK